MGYREISRGLPLTGCSPPATPNRDVIAALPEAAWLSGMVILVNPAINEYDERDNSCKREHERGKQACVRPAPDHIHECSDAQRRCCQHRTRCAQQEQKIADPTRRSAKPERQHRPECKAKHYYARHQRLRRRNHAL